MLVAVHINAVLTDSIHDRATMPHVAALLIATCMSSIPMTKTY